jgi:hypothetical protein
MPFPLPARGAAHASVVLDRFTGLELEAVVILPRLARAFDAPAVAAGMGLILVGVAIFGLVTDDIKAGYALVMLAVGLINLVRTLASRSPD